MQRHKLHFFAIFAIILGVCAAGWFFSESARNHQPHSPSSPELRRAPDFSLKDRDGRPHSLAEWRGKLRMIHFWAAWCPPCLSEIPELVEFAEHFQDESRLEIIAISLDEKWEDAEKILKPGTLPKNLLSLLDGGAKISDAYGTYQFPETYLVNSKDEILAKWVGAQPWSSPKTEAVLREEISREKP